MDSAHRGGAGGVGKTGERLFLETLPMLLRVQ
jgi:hypothetical protein